MENTAEMMSDDDFVNALESCELPNQVFRHREHVRLTFIYLRRYGFAGAGTRIAEAIRRYAAHNGAPGKYHETITVAWLRIVYEAAAGMREDAGFEELVEAFPSLLNKSTLQEYYSSELLGSEAARVSFVEADRKRLPGLVHDTVAEQGRVPIGQGRKMRV
jgi:hypothetical protein